MARAYGVSLPWPIDLPANDFRPVAEWIATRRRQGVSSAVTTYASAAVRVVAAARDLGVSLEGSLFVVGGETLTAAKRRTIEAAGVAAFPRYSIGEFGAVGHACRQITTGNSVHLFTDSLAVITHRRPAPLSAAPVNSLLFTALQPHAPCVLINAEMDDSGAIDPHSECGCTFGRAGLTTVIRDISSYGKLTGHAVTLVGTEVLRVLEEVLPARFGGSAGDYQLVEQDSADQSRLVLRVSPRVDVSSIEAVKHRFLQELRACQGGQIASRIWRDAAAVDVLHQEPITTALGKVLALHVLGGGRESPVAHGS
jgi:hypothetical protein